MCPYYKRFTDVLPQDAIDMSKIDYYSDFYKVNDSHKFRAFSDPDKRIKGFARDLFIDLHEMELLPRFDRLFKPTEDWFKRIP